LTLSLRNRELFSNHWLTRRLTLEPEWRELPDAAAGTLEQLAQLWAVQKGRVESYGGEQALEQAFIQPVFQGLGWHLLYQTHLRGRKPDYALFRSDVALEAALAAGRTSPDFWKHPDIVADAKAWHVALDRPAITGQQREYPPEQIEWYLTNSQLDYGILTNGRVWRLVPRAHDPGQPRFQTYLECDLAALLEDRVKNLRTSAKVWYGFEDFLAFFLFFSPHGYTQALNRPPLVERARKGSSEYRLGVGDGLKERVFEALSLCIEGFLSYPPNNLTADAHLEICREQSLVLLYRLLFIFFAEDRQLLPFRVERQYTENRSLSRFRDEIASRLDRISDGREPDYEAAASTLWPDLLVLFDLIDRGAARYKVPAYNGGLFDPERHPFLLTKCLPDRYVARVIDALGRAYDPVHPTAGLLSVDYRDLAIQHLGNVYEGLLELRPHCATERMAVIRKRQSDSRKEAVIAATALVPRGYVKVDRYYEIGSIYLLTDKGERRVTGSYYTPNLIVDDIVEKILGPICEDIDRGLTSEIRNLAGRASGASIGEPSETLSRLRAQYGERILRLRILDPAMGSGHFLIRACQYLAEQIATNPHAADPTVEGQTGDESILAYWRRRVAEMCLYGVDRNPLAVELAKLALWLETVSIGQPLTFLDHHLRHGDSLVGADLNELRTLPGAPPLIADAIRDQVQQILAVLVQAFAEISSIPSDSVQHVKQKEGLFLRKCEQARRPLRTVADIWCGTFFAPAGSQITAEQYEQLLASLKTPKKFAALTEAHPYSEVLSAVGSARVAPFHWQLEFPEVFIGAGESEKQPGFDAIIGNPPYDVLSDKETGRDLSRWKAFYGHLPQYEPSFVDKNNLYKLFVCRSISLLSPKGRLGFIVPMAIMGDRQASGIRREIVRVGAFTGIEAFPQKDDPYRRVFRDAKLSTAIIALTRAETEQERALRFRVRVHPEDKIVPESPALMLSSAEIPRYDPENFTVVSCPQADWDLATRMMESGRLRRLGELCVSYQGEVNETTDVRFLSANAQDGPLVLRGSNVSLYALRNASQGESLYLREQSFIAGKSHGSKASHGRSMRVGFQRSSPQNNFRRIIACMIPAGHYCFDTISYVRFSDTRLDPYVLLALLNSKLLDWYFRLGSSNSKVNEYQFDILPCPVFSAIATAAEKRVRDEAQGVTAAGRWDQVPSTVAPLLQQAPFSPALASILSDASSAIAQIECSRTPDLSRFARSALATEAQPIQDAVDKILFAIAGLSESESNGLQERLENML
jgi:hypothetical protein